MNCAWQDFLALVPQCVRPEVDRLSDSLQELRLRQGQAAELVTGRGSSFSTVRMEESHIRFAVNAASRYSPWAAATAAQGYITAPGGHRLGLCGSLCPGGMKEIRSVNIRVARDLTGIADRMPMEGNILILGPPGSGKTTMLRDLIRRISRQEPVAVVDERSEIFPDGFERGKRTDVICGCSKAEGLETVLRSMGPRTVAVDEITAAADCDALQSALWCGVRILATAHAASVRDLRRRQVYRPLAESGCFDTLVVLRQDKSWYTERMTS